MKKIFFILALFLSTQFQAHAEDLSFNRYHSQTEINAYMKQEAQSHPDLVTFKNLGQSLGKREISYIIISHKVPSSVPAIYFNGTHHGDEWSSTEGILGLADYLISHHGDPAVTELLNSYAIYLQPLINPDGHAAQTREDSLSRDPNRDYSFPNRPDSESFAVPEIQLVKKLVDSIHPVLAAAYHSGIEEVLWPWCYTDSAPTDKVSFAKLAQASATAMEFDRYLQSYDDYATDGEFIDYVYWKYKTKALTFEISEEKTPAMSDLPGVVNKSVRGALTLMNSFRHPNFQSLPATGKLGQYGHLGLFPRTGPRFE
jgi:hypothetical protein